jgi:hypothetical protein
MPIPILTYLVGGLAVAAVAGLKSETQTMREIKAARSRVTIKSVTAGGGPTVPTGPLPAQAIAAWNSPKKGRGRGRSAWGKNNDLHKKGAWFRFATYSDKWDRKLEKLRYYSNPPGVLYVKKSGTKAMAGNLAWMTRCPDSWYPGFGRAASLNIRLSGLKPWLGNKADWKEITGAVKKSIEGIPDVVKAAGVVVAGIFTLGASTAAEPGEQVKSVSDGIKAAIAPFYGAGAGSDKRLDVARAVVTALRVQYINQLMDANPWAVKDGRLDIGKHYMADPKTWEDLFKPGKSRPLLFNPPKSK